MDPSTPLAFVDVETTGLSIHSKHHYFVRLVFPAHFSALIDRLGLHVTNRHRAFDDAHAIWQFYQQIKQRITENEIVSAISRIAKRPALPSAPNRLVSSVRYSTGRSVIHCFSIHVDIP